MENCLVNDKEIIFPAFVLFLEVVGVCASRTYSFVESYRECSKAVHSETVRVYCLI